MAETTETADVGVSDSELFSNAVAPSPQPDETPPPHPNDEARDVRGRFRPQQAAPTEPAVAPPPVVSPPVAATAPGMAPASPGAVPPPPDDANVPSWRLREEREQREALTRQLQDRDAALRDMQRRMEQFERQQAPNAQNEIPDPLIDPKGYRSAIEGQFASKLQTIQLENNLQLTRLQHGEVFDSAYQAFMQAAQGDPGFARLIVNSPNPGSSMVNWYRRAVTLSRVGDDPDKFIEAEISRRLSDPAFLSRAVEAARAHASGQPPQPGAAPGRPNNVTQIPPSLSRVPSGSPTDVVMGGMPDDETLFRESLPPPRKRG